MKISLKRRKAKYVYNSISGFFSFKGKKSVWYESNLEKNFLHMISFSDSVVDIEAQPFTIEYKHDGKWRKYTPDFLVYFKPSGYEFHSTIRPKPLLVEVKRKEELVKKFCEFKPKFKAGIQHAANEGLHFKIYDEKRIFSDYHENVTYLKSFSRSIFDPQEAKKITDYLTAIGHASIKNIISYLYNTEEEMIGLRHIFQLLLKGEIITDLQKPISNNTIIENRLKY